VSESLNRSRLSLEQLLNATWQRGRVHFMRNVLAHAGKRGAAWSPPSSPPAFAQDDAEAARARWLKVADQHRAKLHSTNPVEHLIGEIKRQTEVVGIFPNEDAIVRPIGAILIEENDDWAVQRLYDPVNHRALER
jgi:putative transposase